MTNTKFFLLASACVFLNSNAQALEVKNLTFDYSDSPLVNITYTTHTPTELEPISHLDNAVKLASVCSITGGCNGMGFDKVDNKIDFDNAYLCREDGYALTGCPDNYIKGAACPLDSKYIKECISPETWCKNNGYAVTKCTLPAYPETSCPHSSAYYKSCKPDNVRACKEEGYSLVCDTGKVRNDNQICSYDDSYSKCVCNPCVGFNYTIAQASEQGYVPGEICNSCGTIKYKREENACEGYKSCDCGGEVGADVCYSGTQQKFSTCKECCDTSIYKYDASNCSGDYQLSGNSCGGKFDSCKETCSWANMYAQSDSYLAWGNECELKRTQSWEFNIDNYGLTSECMSSCQSIPINFSYNGRPIQTTLKYFTPSEEQKNSPETLVTTCQAYKDALNNPDIFNIRISGHLICNKMSILNEADKHIYGLDKSKDILETTGTSNSYLISAKHVVLSNLTINVETDRNNSIYTYAAGESTGAVAENVDFYVNEKFDEDIFFTKGDNHIYITDQTVNTPTSPFGTLIVGPDASLTVVSPKKADLYYQNVILLGKFQSQNNFGLRYAQLLMQGNPKTFRNKTLNNGTYYGLFKDSFRSDSWHLGYALDVVGDGSSVSFALDSISDDFAIGNNATATVERLSDSLRFSVGTGAIVNGSRVSPTCAGKNMTFPNEPYSNLFK